MAPNDVRADKEGREVDRLNSGGRYLVAECIEGHGAPPSCQLSAWRRPVQRASGQPMLDGSAVGPNGSIEDHIREVRTLAEMRMNRE